RKSRRSGEFQYLNVIKTDTFIDVFRTRHRIVAVPAVQIVKRCEEHRLGMEIGSMVREHPGKSAPSPPAIAVATATLGNYLQGFAPPSRKRLRRARMRRDERGAAQ